MSRTTQIFAAYNALLAQVQAALPTLVNVGEIYDGPQPNLPTGMDLVFIGCDDPIAASTVLAIDSGRQEFRDLGAFDKKETFTIYCSYVAWTGDNNLPDCRNRAASNIALIETALRPNVTGGPTGADGMLGTNTTPGPLAPDGYCDLSVIRLQQVQTANGPAVHVQFSVDCIAYI